MSLYSSVSFFALNYNVHSPFFDPSGFEAMSMALEAPLCLRDYHEKAVLL